MQVILKKDVKGVGKAEQVVEVADGYGRNYLIPRGLAVPATAENRELAAAQRRKVENARARALREAREQAQRLAGAAVEIRMKAGENGRLFGSVTSQDIADALGRACGVRVDKRKIELEEPIRSLGDYEVTIRLHPEVTAAVSVQVRAEGRV